MAVYLFWYEYHWHSTSSDWHKTTRYSEVWGPCGWHLCCAGCAWLLQSGEETLGWCLHWEFLSLVEKESHKYLNIQNQINLHSTKRIQLLRRQEINKKLGFICIPFVNLTTNIYEEVTGFSKNGTWSVKENWFAILFLMSFLFPIFPISRFL